MTKIKGASISKFLVVVILILFMIGSVGEKIVTLSFHAFNCSFEGELNIVLRRKYSVDTSF